MARTDPAPQRGSVLMLFPVGLLIVFVLAAVAVDSAITFLGQRELANAVVAAANDAATEAVSNAGFYRRGDVELESAEAARVAEARVRSSVDAARHLGLSVRATVVRPAGVACAWQVRVEASSTVHYLFAGVMPGAARQATVKASAISSPVQEATGC